MRWHIHYRQILIVKQPMPFGAFTIALDQIGKELEVFTDVRVHIHGHKTGELNKPWIHQLTTAGKATRHPTNDVIFKPLKILARGVIIHFGRIDTDIDRPTHQRHTGWQTRVVILRHQTGSNQSRYTRLAHRNHVNVWPQGTTEFNQVVDIIIKMKSAICHRYITGIFPVSDIYLMIRQKLPYRPPQQGRIMA